MLSKGLTITLVVLMFFGGTVLAFEGSELEETLTPEKPHYNVGRAIEDAQYELFTDLEEKILALNAFSERRLAAMQSAGNNEDFNELLGTYEEHEQEMGKVLEELEESDGLDAEHIYALVEESSEKKSTRLIEMVEDKDLPVEAVEGVERALENLEMAMSKLEEALSRAQEAHDEARSRANQDDVSESGPPEDIDFGPPDDTLPGSAEDVPAGKPEDINENDQSKAREDYDEVNGGAGAGKSAPGPGGRP